MSAPSETQDQNAGETDMEIQKKRRRITEGVVFTSLTGFAVLVGFGSSMVMAKKRDPSHFLKGMFGSELPDFGATLGMRALFWGTVYSVSGFSLFCFTVWKLMGVKNLDEFRVKVQSVLPVIPKKNPEGKSDFKSFREMMHYLEEQDKLAKQQVYSEYFQDRKKQIEEEKNKKV